MVIKEQSPSAALNGYMEKLCYPTFLSRSAKNTMARKPYHLDNGTNLLTGCPKPVSK